MKDINGDGVVDKKDVIAWTLLAAVVAVFGTVVVSAISHSTVVDNTVNQASAIQAVSRKVDIVVVPVDATTSPATATQEQTD